MIHLLLALACAKPDTVAVCDRDSCSIAVVVRRYRRAPPEEAKPSELIQSISGGPIAMPAIGRLPGSVGW